jgi:hypothetical protein
LYIQVSEAASPDQLLLQQCRRSPGGRARALALGGGEDERAGLVLERAFEFSLPGGQRRGSGTEPWRGLNSRRPAADITELRTWERNSAIFFVPVKRSKTIVYRKLVAASQGTNDKLVCHLPSPAITHCCSALRLQTGNR